MVRGALLLLEESNEDPDRLVFDPSTPSVLQRASWSCSAASMAWMMRSVGLKMTENDALVILGPRLNAQVGLLDGSGMGMVAALESIEFEASPLRADAEGRSRIVSFDEVAETAGLLPMAMGGAAFYHWVGVRGYDGRLLHIANPAPGYKGIWDTLDRGQFRALGPFYAVVIDI